MECHTPPRRESRPRGIGRTRPSDERFSRAHCRWNHGFAIRYGWADWRRDLGDACKRLRNGSQCTFAYQSMSGNGARSALELYARSVFCLMPPGDVLARGAIVDAISVGCIPVFFHPAQQALWPLHWRGETASILFDWTDPRVRNASVGTPRREAIGREAALVALRVLFEMEAGRVRLLQRAVGHAARRMFYRAAPRARAPPHAGTAIGGGGRAAASEDALDILLDELARQ